MKKFKDTATGTPECDSPEILSPAELLDLRKQLRKREHIIQQSCDGWKASPVALTEIRDLRLYRAEGFSDFGRYCKERLHLGKSTVNRHISIGEVYNALASAEAKILPKSERQMRPLLNLRQEAPEAWGNNVRKVWEKTVNDAEITKKPITEKSVIHARKQLGFDPKPKEPQPELDLESLWKRTEDLLCHEREFWSVEYLPEMCARVIKLMRRWAPQKMQQADHPAEPSSSEAASKDAPEVQKRYPQRNGRAFSSWEHLNWRLHNRDLAIIWNLKPLTVRQMRYRKGHGPAQNRGTEIYAKEMELEKAKAQEFAQPLADA